MKRLLLYLSMASSIGLAWPFYDPNHIDSPSTISDSIEIRLYDYYLGTLYPSFDRAQFLDNYQVYSPAASTLPGYINDTIGVWRANNDTLLIYENYFYPGEQWPPDPHSELAAYFYYGDTYRMQVADFETYLDSTYCFGANVSAFKLHNYGDFLTTLTQSPRFKWNYVPLSIYKYFYFDFKSNIWQFTKVDWKHGIYMVKQIRRIQKTTTIITLEKDGILFQIVNPMCYLKNDTVEYYDKRDEAALAGWMDSVKTGSRHRFTLQRPDYPADSTKNVRYLRTLPDSLYISRAIDQARLSADQRAEIARTANPDTCREAYGYFFAKMIE